MRASRLILLVITLTVGSAVLSIGGSRTGKDPPPGTIPLQGAGSTFAAPLYKTWLDAYQKRHPEVALRYDAIGSGEGTQQFLAGAVDFGASDAAMADAEMAEITRGVQLVLALAGNTEMLTTSLVLNNPCQDVLSAGAELNRLTRPSWFHWLIHHMRSPLLEWLGDRAALGEAI
jgi:hypothetical protein